MVSWTATTLNKSLRVKIECSAIFLNTQQLYYIYLSLPFFPFTVSRFNEEGTRGDLN